MLNHSCETLQKIVMNPNTISDSFCRYEILEYTKAVCRCTTPDGTLVDEIYESPTASPAPAGPEVKNVTATSMSTSIFTTQSLKKSRNIVVAAVFLIFVHC